MSTNGTTPGTTTPGTTTPDTSTSGTTTAPDGAEHLAMASRTVASASRDGVPTKVVALEQAYPVGVEELWDAVTDGSRISRWLAPVSGDLRLGGRYQIEGNAGGLVEGCDRPRRLEVTWEYGGDVSWVVATLAGDDRTSRLRVEHVAHVDQQRWDEFGPSAVGIGWDLMLLGLGLHLGSGSARDELDPEAWMAGPQGRAFVAESARAWCEADVAGGADESAARDAAARCVTAYGG